LELFLSLSWVYLSSSIIIISGMPALGMHSAKHEHQSPEWTILSRVICFIQAEVIGFQVVIDSLELLLLHQSMHIMPLFFISNQQLMLTLNSC